MTQYDLGRVVGDTGATGNGISTISKTGTSGKVDTYTITFTNGNTTTFTVTNGNDGEKGDKGDKGDKGNTGNTGATGNGISTVAKTGTSGLVDTYTITFTNGTTTTFTVTNGADGTVPIVTSWESTLSDSKVASEKLTKNALDGKLDNTIGSSAVTIASNDNIVITDTSDSNKVKKVANLLASQVKDSTAHSNIGSSANDTQATINSDIDTALSNKVSKSSTSGLLKNDGTVDTTSYSTFSGSYNDLSNKPSIPSSSSDLSDGSNLVKKSSTSGLLKNDGSVDTNAYITSSALPTIQTSWGSTTSDSKVASEKLIKSSLDGKLDNTIGSSAVTIASNDNILITDTSDNSKVKKVANILASQVKDGSAHSNIGSSANATQSSINSSIDTAFDTKLFKYYYAPNDFITPNRWYTDYDHCYPTFENGNLIFTTDCEYRFVFSEYPYKVRENFSIRFKYKASASNQYTTLKVNGTKIVQNTTTENDVEITTTSGNAIVTNHTTNQTWDLQGNLERIDLLVRTGTASVYDYTYSANDSFEKQVPTEKVIEETALSNIGTSKWATQSEINSAIASAIANMLTTSDVVDNLTSTSATAPLSAKQGKALNDMIGSAITYIIGSGS